MAGAEFGSAVVEVEGVGRTVVLHKMCWEVGNIAVAAGEWAGEPAVGKLAEVEAGTGWELVADTRAEAGPE